MIRAIHTGRHVAEAELRYRVAVSDLTPDPIPYGDGRPPIDDTPVVGKCRECDRPITEATRLMYGYYCRRSCLRSADL